MPSGAAIPASGRCTFHTMNAISSTKRNPSVMAKLIR